MVSGEMREYKIIEARDADTLSRYINEDIQKGWEPIGGIATKMYLDGVCIMSQAMIKVDPRPGSV